MFNGLIREIANVISFDNNILKLKTKHKPNLGDSIAVNGACLSVIEIFNDGFSVELSNETRKNIAIKNLKNQVHIEPALRYGDRIDGHLMQGHIDAIGIIKDIKKDENGIDFYIFLPNKIMPFMANKGSIGVDGVSLTINEVLKDQIRLTIIPITFKETLFKNYKINQEVNIESDLLARYIQRQLSYKEGLTWEEVEKISYLY